MSSTEQVQALLDRAEIAGLVDRYLAAIDEGGPFDDAWSRSLFTDDVRITFPVGAHEGIAGLARLHEGIMAKWERTLHFSTNHLIELDGDRATLRAPLIGTHVHRPDDPGEMLVAAHLLAAEAVRTGAGWRFERFAMQLVWREGDPPAGVRVDA